MVHRVFIFFLISFSLAVFSGGYVYADETTASNPEEANKCNTPQYQEMKEKYVASAFIDLDYRNLRDFLQGQELNDELGLSSYFFEYGKDRRQIYL